MKILLQLYSLLFLIDSGIISIIKMFLVLMKEQVMSVNFIFIFKYEMKADRILKELAIQLIILNPLKLFEPKVKNLLFKVKHNTSQMVETQKVDINLFCRPCKKNILLNLFISVCSCPVGWTLLGKKCYKHFSKKVNYTSAVTLCKMEGGAKVYSYFKCTGNDK